MPAEFGPQSDSARAIRMKQVYGSRWAKRTSSLRNLLLKTLTSWQTQYLHGNPCRRASHKLQGLHKSSWPHHQSCRSWSTSYVQNFHHMANLWHVKNKSSDDVTEVAFYSLDLCFPCIIECWFLWNYNCHTSGNRKVIKLNVWRHDVQGLSFDRLFTPLISRSSY